MERSLQYVLLVAVAVALSVLVIRWMEPGLVFFPAPYPQGIWDPERLGVQVEDVWLRADDGTRLHAWWLPPTDGAEADDFPALLWCHGNAGNITGRAPQAGRLAAAGIGVLLFDYRGYGRSEGSPSEDGIYADADAAYAHLTGERGIDPRRLVLMGRSLGSAPAARLARHRPHAGLVLVSPFPSARAMARHSFGLPLDLVARSRFPVARWVERRSGPLLVIHGLDDRIVPPRMGRDVYDAAAEPKEWLEVPGATHNDILERDAATLQRLVAFVESATGAGRNGE